MSAFGSATLQEDRDLSHLAPLFGVEVNAFLKECAESDDPDLQAVMVWEGLRSDALALVYYKRGRPPTKEYPRPVTNAKNSWYTWHGYGLAIDVVHKTKMWDAGDAWYEKVSNVAKKHSMKWGGDWKHPDMPHLQWARCKPSPSTAARELRKTQGINAVQVAVGARLAA